MQVNVRLLTSLQIEAFKQRTKQNNLAACVDCDLPYTYSETERKSLAWLACMDCSPGRPFYTKRLQDNCQHLADGMLDLALAHWCNMLQRMHPGQKLCRLGYLYGMSKEHFSA